jgi:nucleotide-binding universal stress UspA family protein
LGSLSGTESNNGGYEPVYTRILLPLDGSETAEKAVPFAVAQAERFRAQLILLRAVEPILVTRSLAALDDARQERMDWARDYLESVATGLREHGIQVKTVVTEEAPNVAITEYAETNEVDLVVLSSRGHSGPSRWLMGSVADRIVRGASVPVLLVRAKEKPRGKSAPGPPND